MHLATLLSLALILPEATFAQAGIISGGIEGCNFVTGELTAACIPNFIAHLIGFIFGFVGLFCLLNIIYAGYEMGLAPLTGDNEKGKTRLRWSLIGFVACASAFLILDFAVSILFG
jgi:hypothetical protein